MPDPISFAGCFLSRQQHLDGEALKQYRETASFLGPGNSDLFDTMSRTVDTRDAGMKKGLKLIAIQVPPLTLWSVVRAGQGLLTLGTARLRACRMLGKHVDLLLLKIQRNLRHRAGALHPKDLLIQFSILHQLFLQIPESYQNPHDSRMDQENCVPV